MKLVGYVRTSWTEQVQGTFASVEEQEEQLRAFAEKAGVKLAKVYTDVGLNPTQGTCAGLISILDAMQESWEAVLVVSPCRVQDMESISFDAVSELKENGKAVFVSNDKTAKVLAKQRPKRVAKQQSQREDETVRRREIAARLFKGREAGAKAGKHQSGPAPFGYRRDYSRRTSEGVLLVPNDEEANVVKMIFREYLRLRSMKRLIKLLDENGLRTRRGKRWSRAGVSWILKNDTYVGRVHFGDIRVKGRHDSIISPIMFNKVQKLIRANNKRNRKQIREQEARGEGEPQVGPSRTHNATAGVAKGAAKGAAARRQRVTAGSGTGAA